MKQTISATVTAGLGKNKHGHDITSGARERALGWAECNFCNIAGGCTTTEGRGLWTNPENGTVVSERVVVFTVLCDAEKLPQLQAAAEQLRNDLEQSCVAFAFSLATVMFV